MFFAIMMFGEQGKEIIYPDPGFPIYASAINYSGAKAVPMALHENNGFAFSADDLLAQINENTSLIILNSPANPTGGVPPKIEMDKLAAGLEKHPDVAILSDEIYSHMLYDGEKHTSMLSYPALRDRLIILEGASKTYAMTGWRLGYAVWPESLIEKATRLAINSHSCVNAATQYAGIAALTGPHDAVQSMMQEFDKRRKNIVTMLNQLPNISCIMPKGAFYAFPNISETGMTSAQIQDVLLMDAHVATIAGTSFGQHGEGFLRFSYANSLENIEKAMERIDTLFRK
jgi:aspartate/methionine/tyrosine aminotransferase